MMGGVGMGWWGLGMFFWPLLFIGLLVWLGYAVGQSARSSNRERIHEAERRGEDGGRDAQ